MMYAIFFYLIIKPLSLLPLPLLYVFSDFLYLVLYKIVGYRKKVVFQNLKNAFPDKSEKEISLIASKFYSHLCDLIVESIRFFSISEKELLRRFVVLNPEILDEVYEKKQNAILVTAHFNNWEIAAMALPYYIQHRVVVLYSRLSNSFFEKKIYQSRTKFGALMVPMQNVRKFDFSSIDRPFLSVYVSDQSPSNPNIAYWTRFLNQDTAVFNGAERAAKRLDAPIFWGKIRKVKRGYYTGELQLIAMNPNDFPPNEITEKFTRMIEQTIMEEPQFWLWTHKRWKHKRENTR